MIEKIVDSNLEAISNQCFRAYAEGYVRIERSFRGQVEALGLPFAERLPLDPVDSAQRAARAGCRREGTPWLPEGLAGYRGRGLTVANDGKSYYVNWQSDACASCRLGLHAKTFLFSTQCPRRCFFCFNHNQADYDHRLDEVNDAVAELDDCFARGMAFTHLALTGGEPLLHAEETVTFFQHAQMRYPDAHTRLYTSGAFLDESLMQRLSEAGLREIRFSIKTEDDPAKIEAVLATIEKATSWFRDVMVEMPVLPNEVDVMQQLMLRLDAIGISGINLLELGYPFAHAEEFARRGLSIKADPLRVLYNYSYAGGLPVSGSEEACLALVEFALDKQLRMGVHYCSMENKFSGQVYQQNAPHAHRYPLCVMSKRDHFLKSAKVFGSDAVRVAEFLHSHGIDAFNRYGEEDLLEFSPEHLFLLTEPFPAMEVALSYYVIERRDDGLVQREVRIDKTTPATFDFECDV